MFVLKQVISILGDVVLLKFLKRKEAGLPEPEITSLDGGILVTLHKQSNDQVNDQVNDQANDQVENNLKSSYDVLVELAMQLFLLKNRQKNNMPSI